MNDWTWNKDETPWDLSSRSTGCESTREMYVTTVSTTIQYTGAWIKKFVFAALSVLRASIISSPFSFWPKWNCANYINYDLLYTVANFCLVYGWYAVLYSVNTPCSFFMLYESITRFNAKCFILRPNYLHINAWIDTYWRSTCHSHKYTSLLFPVR
jgi:hypothetical protein